MKTLLQLLAGLALISTAHAVEALRVSTFSTVGPELYADGLGDGAESTYAGMFRHNVTAIVDALK